MADLQARLQAAVGDAYRIEKELGGGGMSRLFLATEASLHRQVVIKLLPPEFASEVSATRFKQEIELAAHLQHPNILPVFTAGAKDDLLFYVMPFVSGESLRHRLTREGKLPVADAVRILHEVADALAHAHAEGVIHRDIKPENILLEGGHAVLTDFGVAKALAESRSGGRLTDTGLALGTPGYMSPEQAAGERHVDARADVYALAVVGYEMLAGVPPFAGPTAQAVIAAHLTATPKPLTDVRPETPPAVANTIARALAKDPAARLHSAAEFRDDIGSASAVTAGQPRLRRGVLAGGALAGAAIIAAVFAMNPTSRTALDPNLVAVAPFDVLAPTLDLWREGLVDVLSRNLDGAGPLRTVSPTIVVRRWTGRADPASATALSRSTGARIVVYGGIVEAGRDSVRLNATVYDAGSGNPLADVDVHDAAVRMDRLGDSLTVAVLRELGRTRPIGAVRLASLGSTSLPAVKAFLKSEQFYRRGDWDSALVYARHAVAIDSGFTLALRRIPLALWWSNDTSVTTYLLRAGARNHGLAPRESLLVTADSLWGALDRGDAPAWPLQRRLLATLQEATRLYPHDPEGWYHLGELGVHRANARSIPLAAEQTLAAFERAFQLDSTFAPAYEHAIDLALRLRGPEVARRYAAAELAQGPVPYFATGLRLVGTLLDPRAQGSPEVARMLDTISGDALWQTTFNYLGHWPDSAETGIRLARLVAVPRHGYQAHEPSDWILPVQLAYRGHLRDARRAALGSRTPWLHRLLFAELTLVGAIPRDSAAAEFGRWLQTDTPHGKDFAVDWSAATGDTASILTLARRADSMARTAAGGDNIRQHWRYLGLMTRPYLALARGDTATALAGFAALPDSLCPGCWVAVLQRVQLLSSRGEDRSVVALLDAEIYPPVFYGLSQGLWALERGRVNERLGNREKAIATYAFVAAVWRHADPELQPYVEEARAALKRLAGEPRP